MIYLLNKSTMQIKSVVYDILTDSVACRDDDALLYLKVLYKLWLTYTTPYEMLTVLNYQSVRVARQETQAEFPELRWAKYQDRQRTANKIKKEKSKNFWDKLNVLWTGN